MADTAKQLSSALPSFKAEIKELSARYIIDDTLKACGVSHSHRGLQNITANIEKETSEELPKKNGSSSHDPLTTNKPLTESIGPRLKSMRTLIVEDNQTDQLIVKNAAEALNLNITLAENGENAIKSLKEADEENPYQLMIIDFKMPELDGLTASRYIKEELNLITPPKIILLSAFQRDEIFSQPNSYNCVNAFLTKPINQQLLSDALVDISDRSALNSEIWPPQRISPIGIDGPITSVNIDELLSKCHILLAEDNLINQRVATGILKLKGIRVTVANNGQEAVDAINNAPPNEFDAVLMDIDMPVLDGYEATSIIKKNPASTNLPILALTAHNTAEDKQKCLTIGMSEYLTKPIKPHLLYETIAKSIIDTEG